jgi:hypothetical protein
VNYLLAPLHSHFDMGFGATGNAFKMAADHLETCEGTKEYALFNNNLPVNFLYRHAIELHLKSAIVIFHKRFRLPYGTLAFDADPMVKLEGTWKPFNRVHGIAALWHYVTELFKEHAEWLGENTTTNWTFEREADDDVATIEAGDPRSTFFRYPTTKDLAADVRKSSMKEFGFDHLEEVFSKADGEQKKVFAMIVETPDRDFVRGYMFDDDAGKELKKSLQRFSQMCDNMHAAMRWELCGGW